MNEQDKQDQEVLELSIVQAQKIIDFGEALTSLENNKSFQKVVLEGYLRDEAVRLTGLLAEPNISADEKASVLQGLYSVSYLRRFLMVKKQLAAVAAKEMIDYREAIDEMNSEQES